MVIFQLIDMKDEEIGCRIERTKISHCVDGDWVVGELIVHEILTSTLLTATSKVKYEKRERDVDDRFREAIDEGMLIY